MADKCLTANGMVRPCSGPASKGSWQGAPKTRSTPCQQRLNRDINAGLANPTIRARLADLGTIPMIFTATEFGAYVAAESEKWAKVIQFAGIKPE